MITEGQVHQLIYKHIIRILEANEVPHYINTIWDLKHDPIGSIELPGHTHYTKIIIHNDTINLEQYNKNSLYNHTIRTIHLSDPASLDDITILNLCQTQ